MDCLEFCQLGFENLTATGVFVAQVYPDLADADRPGSHQHAFEEAVRVQLQVVPVLERAGLAFVNIDRHVTRCVVAGHNAPLAADRETCTPQAAQAGVFHDLDEVFRRMFTGNTVLVELITAIDGILFERDVVGDGCGNGFGLYLVLYNGCRGMINRVLANHCHRRMLATSYARHGLYAYVRAKRIFKFMNQVVGTEHGTGD